ncbi:hypothetical protein ACHAXT_006173 [Thalassiosira profunda]
MEVEAPAPSAQDPLTPSASAEEKPASDAPKAAEVSPGDGAYSPSTAPPEAEPHEGAGAAEGFGPPPAFPGAKANPGKRKRTLMAVSAAGGAPLEDLSSEDDDEEAAASKEGKGGAKPSQNIHRLPQPAASPPAKDDKNYDDAMLLASLSDVESPKKAEDQFVEDTVQKLDKAGKKEPPKSPKSASGTSTSSANTPLRSNVKASPPLEGAKPFALLPKPRKGSSPTAAAPAPQSPDGRDPKAARTSKHERGSREGHAGQPPAGYPGYPGYPYPGPYGAHPGYAGYPYGYPGYGPPGYPPRAYYPGPPGAPPPPGGAQPPAPERWGPYHSPKPENNRKASEPATTSPVRSGGPREEPPYHPLSGASGATSHVVPAGEERPPYGGYDPRYGPPREGYYPPPPGAEAYPAVSRDENSPDRARASGNAGTPPRGGYEYYPEGAPPPPPGYGPPVGPGYHPDTPPSYGPYGHGPPPVHDPYEPYDYSAGGSPGNEDYQVPATVSNEAEPRHHRAGAPPVPPPAGPHPGYHQFRKGGRSIHSEPIVLRKKFSWRNYPELEEYLIANRTDYLRHSALNYTAEQKHFNNRLTEGLLELAAKLNYVFDETCFNFVAVRDRIRCYYKSYVQSSKKRGVVVGFSKEKAVKRARRAGAEDATAAGGEAAM